MQTFTEKYYIKCDEDKNPIIGKGEKIADNFQDSMDDMPNAGRKLPLDIVVLDFDGFNIEEEYYINWIIDEYNPFWVKTTRGYHLYFKKPAGIKFNRKHCLTWIGLQCETLVSIPAKGKKEQTYCHPLVKQFGVERERSNKEFDFSNLSELPKELYPLYVATKRSQQHIGLAGTAEGTRNVTINEHLFLIRTQYEIDENDLWEVAQKINNMMLVPPLEDKELRERWKSVMDAEIKPTRGGRNKPQEDDSKKRKEKFSIGFLRDYLKDELQSQLYYDVISKQAVWNGLQVCKDHQIPTYLYDQLNDMSKSSMENVRAYLNYLAFENERNYILEKIIDTDWDGQDRLKQIYDVLGIHDEFEKTLILKWMWQSLTLLHNKDKNEFESGLGADGCLVFQGRQGIGKTEFFKYLCSFAPKYFKMGAELKFENKDTVIEALSYWIVELGEVEGTLKKSEVTDLKNFITSDEDSVRLPYGRDTRKSPRMTSFCATCNSSEFLRDETGNRRFWIIQLLNRINRESLYEIDILQLWKQIYDQCDVSFENHGFRLSVEEQIEINKRSDKFQVPLKGEDTVRDILAKIYEGNYIEEYMTVTDWMDKVGNFKNLTSREVGKVLTKLGFDTERVRIHGDLGRFRKLPSYIL